MAISPNIGSEYAERVAELYRDAELRIIAAIAAALAQGMDAPDWEVQTLARLQVLGGEAQRLLEAIAPEAAERIRALLLEAYATGGLSALADVGGLVAPTIDVATDAQNLAALALAGELTGATSSAVPSILRAVDDVAREVVADAVASVTLGGETRRQAVQRALDGLVTRGLVGVDTRRGRMDLPTYVEMAVRTGVARTAIAGHLDQMDTMGLDLVVIQPGPRACRICDRWARMVLSRSGRTGRLQFPSVVGQRAILIDVPASLATARRAGWGHPNCRCSVAAYLPGVTRASELQRPRWNREEYEAQQRQREIERNIRAWKRREAAAITPEAAQEARDRVRAWQAAMRDHLERNPFLKRQSRREQVV